MAQMFILLGVLVLCSASAAEENAIEEKLTESKRTLEKHITEFKELIATAVRDRSGLDDRQLQERAHQAHTLLWKYYFDPRTNMVYTILEPHTGQIVFPTKEEVLSGIPNANGWSTCIEDCAGYGNGKHLAWLVARHDVTGKPEHAEQARAIFNGLCTLGTVRKGDEPFREIVRGVLPDGKTYYVGKGQGSSGDNYNGYSYAMWRYYHSPIATDMEKERIRSITNVTCYRGGGAFAAMAGDITGDPEFTERYEKRKGPSIEKLADQTITTYQSWGAVQKQLHYAALRELDPDPLCKRVFEHAMRGNAWGRCTDILAGLDFDPQQDDYLHRVKTVRNPLDGMLAVMLSGDREAIESMLPLYRVVIGQYDFGAFRDQRQLTPFLGAYWLAVKQGYLKCDPSLKQPNISDVWLTPIDPTHTPVVTYFSDCNPVAVGVHEEMRWNPGPPNWRMRTDQATVVSVDGTLRMKTGEKGSIWFEAISEPWLVRVSGERGYSIEVRLSISSGKLVISFADGTFAEKIEMASDGISLKNAGLQVNNTFDTPACYTIQVKGRGMQVLKEGRSLLTGELKRVSTERRLVWGTPEEGKTRCEVDSLGYTVSDRFKYPRSDSK